MFKLTQPLSIYFCLLLLTAIVIDLCDFYVGTIHNLVCGPRKSFQINPIIQREFIVLGDGDSIEPCVEIYHITRNIFFCISVAMLYVLGYDDPKMTPSAIQNRLFENHLTALKGKLGSGPYNIDNIEKCLKKILLFGQRENGKKSPYHYEKFGDNIIDNDFEDKFNEMRDLAFSMATTNIAGDGTYTFGSNVMSPYFKYINEDDNLSDSDIDAKENKNDDSKKNKIQTYESQDFLKRKHKIKCRLLVFANHANLILDMCLSPDQSGEGEAHKYLVSAWARVFMQYLDQVDECYDYINFTTDGIKTNEHVPSKTKELCIRNYDVDEKWMENFVINVCSQLSKI